jgi:L-ascorbate metabolism protein UlaG (beta-lactamase superfamily)
MNIHLSRLTKLFILVFTIATGMIIMETHLSCTQSRYPKHSEWEKRIEKSPQFRNGRFQHGGMKLNMSIGDVVSTGWGYLFGSNRKTPDTQLPRQAVDLSLFSDPDTSRMAVAWLGHSSLLIHLDGYNLLTDPVFEKHLSIVGPTRFNGDIPLDINELPRIDTVIISHDHYDHLSKSTLQAIDAKVNKYIVPLAVGARLIDWGIAEEKIVELDWWEKHRLNATISIVATPAMHFSGRGLMDRDKTLWASWVILAPDHRLYFGGDSAYFPGFKEIGKQYGPFDMTFLECGAYNPAWHEVHMFPEETVQAHLDLKGNVLHPIHWGTFKLALHAWDDPMKRLTAAASSANIRTATPVVGQSTIFGSFIPNGHWWEPGWQSD